ncbi:MAG: hypothetical protein LBM03_00485 [Erysipelotrichaceae bacterium]|jgi:acyl-ACP thioesterase|nr:hypothetical protein [Erysipelotrichaceae bacterium]
MEDLRQYSKTYVITTNFLDRFDDLSPMGVLDLCQDIAGRHAELLGCGFEAMVNKNLYWVVARNEVNYLREVPYGEDLTLITWPLKPSRFFFDRDYEIRDKNNNVLITVRSRWLLIDTINRKMQPSSSYDYPFESIDKNLYDYDFPSLKAVESETSALVHKVTPSEVDHNLHFNNSRYAELVYNVLSLKDKNSIKSFLIYYHSEVKMDEEIRLVKNITDNKVSISGYKGDILSFNALVELKK